MSAPPGTCDICGAVCDDQPPTGEQSEWVLQILAELIDYHDEADTDRGDEIATELCHVFDIVKRVLPLPEGSPWVLSDDDDDDDDERGAK